MGQRINFTQKLLSCCCLNIS